MGPSTYTGTIGVHRGAEVGQTLDLDLNKESLWVALNLINELRDKSRIREEACKMWVARRYNSKVKPRNFQKGDMVW